ncbi:hypothetical protein F1880_001638 [Penicillium rolfsii]|nr:hypothetical protein F1880_001638 [Penicillium rolfsii]
MGMTAEVIFHGIPRHTASDRLNESEISATRPDLLFKKQFFVKVQSPSELIAARAARFMISGGMPREMH